MTELAALSPLLAFGMIGWQEIVILICPFVGTAAIVLPVLYFTGVIGNRNKRQ